MFTGVTNQGEATVLNLLFQGSRNPRLGMFKNDYTPDDSTIPASLVACDFPGYIALDLSAMAAPVTMPDGQSLRTYIDAVFERTVAGTRQDAYGWYILLDDPSGATLVYAAKRFGTRRSVQAAGEQVKFTLDLLATDLGE